MADHTRWEVLEVARVVDGDTIRLVRCRRINLDGRDYVIADAPTPRRPDGVSVRLVWVDTPERGDDRYREATQDLRRWVDEVATGPLHVVCYESAGWDRLLGDLRDASGVSASQWLMADRGWPPYTG